MTFSGSFNVSITSAIALLLAAGVALKGAFRCKANKAGTSPFTFSSGCERKSRARIRPHVNNFGGHLANPGDEI